MKEWFDDDRFWVEMAPYMFDEERRARAVAQVDAVIDLLGIEPGAAVLDLCCGPGRHSTQLHALGFRVTALDRTHAYLEEVRSVAPEIETVESDMRAFTRPGAFDAVINLFTSFGYFQDPEDDARVVRNMHASLKPGGKLLIDTKGREAIAQQFDPRRWLRAADGALWLNEIEIVDDWAAARVTWYVVKDGVTREYRFWHRLYTGTDLRRLLLEAGFASVDLYGKLDGTPYGPGAPRLIAVARTS